jgi:hypothetical protein
MKINSLDIFHKHFLLEIKTNRDNKQLLYYLALKYVQKIYVVRSRSKVS